MWAFRFPVALIIISLSHCREQLLFNWETENKKCSFDLDLDYLDTRSSSGAQMEPSFKIAREVKQKPSSHFRYWKFFRRLTGTKTSALIFSRSFKFILVFRLEDLIWIYLLDLFDCRFKHNLLDKISHGVLILLSIAYVLMLLQRKFIMTPKKSCMSSYKLHLCWNLYYFFLLMALCLIEAIVLDPSSDWLHWKKKIGFSCMTESEMGFARVNKF